MNPPDYSALYPPPPTSARAPSPSPGAPLYFPPPPKSPIHNLRPSGGTSRYVPPPNSQPYVPGPSQNYGQYAVPDAGSPYLSTNTPRPEPHSRRSSFFKGVGTLLGEALKEAAVRADERAAKAEAERHFAAQAHAERAAAEQAEAERLEAERLEEERQQAQRQESERFNPQSAPYAAATTTNPHFEYNNSTANANATNPPPSAETTEETMNSLLKMLSILAKPSDVQETATPTARPVAATRFEPTPPSIRTSTPAGWRSQNVPLMGVSFSLPAQHSLLIGGSGPGQRVLNVSSGRYNSPFTFVLQPLYSIDGVREWRERQNRAYRTNGGTNVTPVSSAQRLPNLSSDVTATSSQHRNDNFDAIYIVILSSDSQGNGVFLNGRSDRRDGAAMRNMADSIARSISFNPMGAVNSAAHLLVGSYGQAASQSSTSYYSQASSHQTTSLYLFPDSFYVLVMYSKTFAFAAGVSGMSSANTTTESGFWDTEGSAHQGAMVLREMGDNDVAGVEKGFRAVQYEIGSYGVVLQMRGKTLRRKGPLRLDDFHSL